MAKLVYLFELDSVRNSNYEIKKGQDALFEEIIKNGNHVVISYNQLVDSISFLVAIKNKETYPYIMKLFTLGAIKYNKTIDINTSSKYLQLAIDSCLKEDKKGFIFSGLPVKKEDKELLRDIKSTLEYSDTDILQKKINNLELELTKTKSQNKIEKLKEEIERLNYINHFLILHLNLSISPLASNKAATNSHTFTEFMEIILNRYTNSKKEFINNLNNLILEDRERINELEATFQKI